MILYDENYVEIVGKKSNEFRDSDFSKKRLFYVEDDNSYPRYDIEKIESGSFDYEYYRITIALAGFKKEDLQITFSDSTLFVRGRSRKNDERELLHKGISTKGFEKIFELSDSMHVRSSFMKDGLLFIDIIRTMARKNAENIEIMSSPEMLIGE
jgi:HSP20 family molecular chaperone IbpA